MSAVSTLFSCLVIIFTLSACANNYKRYDASHVTINTPVEKLAYFTVTTRYYGKIYFDGALLHNYAKCCSMFSENRIYLTPGKHTFSAIGTVHKKNQDSQKKDLRLNCEDHFSVGNNGKLNDILQRCYLKNLETNPDREDMFKEKRRQFLINSQ